MFVSHHTLKWTRTCRSHGRHPHAHTAHFLLNRHTDQPHAGTRARRDVALRDRVQPEPVQTEQHPAVERARLGTKLRGFLRFFDHTPNKNARPIHTQMRRASYDPRTPITSACMHVIAEIDVLCMQFGSVNSAEMRGNLRTGSGKGGSGALNGPLMHAAS